MPYTLAHKIWDKHVIASDDADLIYIDMHLTHEVTSPQPFEALRRAGRKVRRPDLTIATSDHDVPTDGTPINLLDERAQRQLQVQQENCHDFGVPLYGLGSAKQGIVHIIGPEQGLTLPGMTIVCGDSHTATHGAFGAVAFGIGTSQVEQVLATQALWMPRPGFSRVTVSGNVDKCSAKDIILAIVHVTGTDGLGGTLVEFAGNAIARLSMEGRMTVCNMAIEAGARSGLIAPDETTFDYLNGREFAPKGVVWEQAVDYWRTLRSDPDAVFDREFLIDETDLVPRATWGINPAQNLSLDERIPDPDSFASDTQIASAQRALEYMDLTPGTAMRDIPIKHVFIGSCTNGRIEDLRAAAQVIAGKKVARHIQALVVPGSMAVKAQAEAEGLDKIFIDAGFSWRNAGCSMCIAMNGDAIGPGERAASTSNRNFESRQGKGGRTHLVSPQVAAASAILGHLSAPEDIIEVV